MSLAKITLDKLAKSTKDIGVARAAISVLLGNNDAVICLYVFGDGSVIAVSEGEIGTIDAEVFQNLVVESAGNASEAH